MWWLKASKFNGHGFQICLYESQLISAYGYVGRPMSDIEWVDRPPDGWFVLDDEAREASEVGLVGPHDRCRSRRAQAPPEGAGSLRAHPEQAPHLRGCLGGDGRDDLHSALSEPADRPDSAIAL